MSLALMDREAVESLAVVEVDCEADPRIKEIEALVAASRRVADIRERLRSLQADNSAELRALWDSLVPKPRTYLALREKVMREIEVAMTWVEPEKRYEERAKIEARHSQECAASWSRHTRRYHTRATPAMREKIAEQRLAENELIIELETALERERQTRERFERFLQQVA